MSNSALKLLFLSLIGFGNHFAKSAFSILGLYMIKDSFITATGFGILVALISLPATILPMFSGMILNGAHHHILLTTTSLLVISCVGEMLLWLSVAVRSYSLAVIAIIIFGSGSACVSPIQRSLISYYLKVSNFVCKCTVCLIFILGTIKCAL